jgi:hypothetical protein
MGILASFIRFWPVRKLIGIRIRRTLADFHRATHEPRQTQDALLRRILGAQAETAFGRDHGFAGIHNRDDFRRQVPVLNYEYLEPYIARCRRGEFRALISEPCVHMFAMTSGTTAARKYIPVTPQYLRDYKRGWNLWGLRAWQMHSDVRARPILQLVGDWDEFRTEAGIPCGALTGLTAHTQKLLVRWLYRVPAAASGIKDVHAKYYIAVRFSLRGTLGMLIAANPSTLVALARTGDQEKETLIRDVYNGTLQPRLNLSGDIRAALAAKLRPDPQRARELEAIVERTGTLYPRDYWSSNRFLIGTWTGGSVAAYLRHFPRYFGDAPVRDIGLLASEGRMSIPFADNTPSGVLDIKSHYFEFLPEAEAGKEKPIVLSADELQEGGKYFILLTTAYGLYRYNISDLVQVTGFHNRTPMIEFLSKGAYFSNITGEKLSEYQVVKAMTELCRSFDLNLTAYSVAPCWHDDRPYYGLFVEANDLADKEQGQRLADALDRQLANINSEYASKRDSRRLDPLRLQLLPKGTWQQWDSDRLTRSGGTLEQYKHPCLINDLKFREGLEGLEELGPKEQPSKLNGPTALPGKPVGGESPAVRR